MEYKYMIVAFLKEQPIGTTLEPPKNPHITVKKKFKLTRLNEQEFIDLLNRDTGLRGSKEVITGASMEYDSSENMVVIVENGETWTKLHRHVLDLLVPISESRDPQFEGDHYLPHITWKLKGEINLNPAELENKTFIVDYLYLIERIHPTKSIAKIVTKIQLTI